MSQSSLNMADKLPKSLSMMSILGLSFAIMAVPFGLSTTMEIGLNDGESATILYGWIFVSVTSLAIAASLAEICAVYPTAGGTYYWAAMLSPKKYSNSCAWICGWFNLVGNWTVCLSINFSGAQLILSSVSLWREDFVAEDWQVVLTFWAVIGIAALVNIFGAKYLDLINKICIYWTAASVVIIICCILSLSNNFRSAQFVFGHFDGSRSGWGTFSWFVGLLQSAYTLTGYGLVASMCEEVQNPEREVPRAIFLSVAIAGITGVIYIIPILFVLPDITTLLGIPNHQPIGLIFKITTGSAAKGVGLLFLIIGIMFFAGVGSLTAASRCTYAFARDGALPGSHIWSLINHRFEIPLTAVLLTATVNCILGCIYFGSTMAFNAFCGVATICLSVSYGIPILISLIRRRKLVKNSTYSLGKFGYVINSISVIWIMFAMFLFSLPTTIPTSTTSMNYASAVFAAFALVSFLYYIIQGRKSYTGPSCEYEYES
ncbi:Amino-acid permease BAT1 [Erysiphe neolycopersici]|uniref:Amino-acid permease BAT1 n=1 Tax=Erysiphe neolycopersici TaxID=212602 RepID=A0A420I871_9PEZI|nr:Amino-acid permease BAT1 [Erysiphe neolycopersici]